jgi:hypothetical protein
MACGIYLADAGMVLGTSDGRTDGVYTNMITAQCAARDARRDFFLSERRLEEFVSAANDW